MTRSGLLSAAAAVLLGAAAFVGLVAERQRQRLRSAP